jgi:hypothetical protein
VLGNTDTGPGSIANTLQRDYVALRSELFDAMRQDLGELPNE